jgi:HD-GYP domain-containing protein (c-di-GMP phosphodiesterase class II)
MKGREGLVTGVLLALAAALLLVPLAYLLALALGGADLAETGPTPASPTRLQRHEPLVWLLLATGGALLALAGWWRERARARQLVGGEERARDEVGERLREQEAKLANERERRMGIETARTAERQWNRQLRAEVARAHAEHGALGRVRDIRELVLRVAVGLAEAEKGMLLASPEDDGDGRLELVASEGFQHDPRDSAVAQRFGEEVLERDRIVREDDRARLDAEKRTPADEEIRNLVAIPIFIQDRFRGVVICANHPDGFENTSEDVLLALGDHAGAVLDNSRLHGALRDAYLATIRLLAEAIEVKDPGLGGHSEAVSEYVSAVADRLGLEPPAGRSWSSARSSTTSGSSGSRSGSCSSRAR